MTPGAWLVWGAGGCMHAHSNEEAALPTEKWRPGASCKECPHKAPQDEAKPIETVVQRKPGGDDK